MNFVRRGRWLLVFSLAATLLAGGAAGSLLGTCGPFTDVAGDSFCPFVLEIFYLGITTGTTPTTYDPAGNVTRLQMATFLSRTVDRVLKRGSPRAALNQFWNARSNFDTTTSGRIAIPFAGGVRSDGADLWVAANDTVRRVRASDGKLLETWTGVVASFNVLVAMGQVFTVGSSGSGRVFAIDPSQPAGAVTTVASNLPLAPTEAAFDGSRIWTSNLNSGSVSIVTPGVSIPWTVTTVTSSSFSTVQGILHDGSNMWVTDSDLGTLLKLDSNGAVLQTVTVETLPWYPGFDGSNIWVPNRGASSVSVVRASNGAVLATLTANGLSQPFEAAFDGERILVTNMVGGSVSLWKAADLTTIGSFPMGAGSGPTFACSDGIHFWVTLGNQEKLAKF